MQEAIHRLDAKVSHIYHTCNTLVEKADGLAMNHAVHMAQASSAAPSTSVSAVQAAVVTPEPAKKKPRLLTWFYSPVPVTPIQSTATTQVRMLALAYTNCIEFIQIVWLLRALVYKLYAYHLYKLYNDWLHFYTNCIGCMQPSSGVFSTCGYDHHHLTIRLVFA